MGITNMDIVEKPFWNKTLRLIWEIWPLGDPEDLKDRLHPELTESDLVILRGKINACLVGRGGEVSARSRAAELGRAYLILNNKGKKRFLELLAREFDVDHDAIKTFSPVSTSNIFIVT